jgi:hypothetical protein
MSKVVRLNPIASSIRPQATSPAAYLNRLRHLSLRAINSRNLQHVANYLRSAKGDSELLQDMKALVVRRLASQALSYSMPHIYRTFDALLTDFPAVPLMRDHMVHQVRELGEAREVIGTCRLRLGDSPMILRAKQEALLFNLTLLIKDNFVDFNGTYTSRFKKAEFIELFSWIWEMTRDFQPRMADELSELIDIHVLNPQLPFDIHLPS